MLRFVWTVSVLLAIVALAGCSSPVASTSTTVDPLAIFPREATWIWNEEGSRIPDEPRLAELHARRLLREEVERAFEEHGYRRIDGAQADYRLTYEIQLNTRIEADHSRSLVVLWLTLSEFESGRNVWAGAGQTKLHVGLTEEERRERLRAELEQMLEEFPPEQRGDD